MQFKKIVYDQLLLLLLLFVYLLFYKSCKNVKNSTSPFRLTPREFNSYGARRVNDQVMIRGTFSNPRIHNMMMNRVSGPMTLIFDFDYVNIRANHPGDCFPRIKKEGCHDFVYKFAKEEPEKNSWQFQQSVREVSFHLF